MKKLLILTCCFSLLTSISVFSQNRIVYAIEGNVTSSSNYSFSFLAKYDFSTNTANPTITQLGDIFNYVPSGQKGMGNTSAIAYNSADNLIYFINRDYPARVYSIDPNNTSDTKVLCSAPGGPGVYTMAAYNPVDKAVYFGSGSGLWKLMKSNEVYTLINAKAIAIGEGDMVFDGLGNLYIATSNGWHLYNGIFDSNNQYIGISNTSTTSPLSIPSGSGLTGVAFINKNNFAYSRASNYPNSPITTNKFTTLNYTANSPDFGDLASSDFPAPSFSSLTNQTTIAAQNISYTIHAKNTGSMAAPNVRLVDTLPAAVSITSITIDGNPVSLTKEQLEAGYIIAGSLAVNQQKTIVITGTYTTGTVDAGADVAPELTNKAYIKFDGVQESGVALQPAAEIDTPLPVIFTSVSGSINNQSISISWSTAKEEHSSFYEVEVSKDGKNFVSLGKIDSKNSPAGSSYTFTKELTANLGVLALLLLPLLPLYKRRKYTMLFLFLGLASISAISACSKTDPITTNADMSLFVRIKQTNSDGSYQYSKIVSISQALQ